VINLVAADPARLDAAMPVVLRDERGSARDVFHKGDYLVIEHPGFDEDRFVAVDYFTHDGQVLHMLPSPKNRDNRLEAARPMLLGDPQRSPESWQIGPPYGRDLVLFVASKRPLYQGTRAQVEPAGLYLRAIERGLAQAAVDEPVRVHFRVVNTVKG
jgi:hypothetical protein